MMSCLIVRRSLQLDAHGLDSIVHRHIENGGIERCCLAEKALAAPRTMASVDA